MSLCFEDSSGIVYALRLAFENSIKAKFDANNVICDTWQTFVGVDISLRNVVVRLDKIGRGREWRRVFVIKEGGGGGVGGDREEILFMTFRNVDQVLSSSLSDAWVKVKWGIRVCKERKISMLIFSLPIFFRLNQRLRPEKRTKSKKFLNRMC